MKRIVLGFSKTAWNKGGIPTFGAGFVAKDFYTSVRRIFPEHRIEYLDHSEYRNLQGIGKIEYFFGISSNFEKFVKKIKPEKSVLISVNHHSLQRRLIKSNAKENNFAKSLLESHDGITSNILDTKYADYILSLGNWNSISSYLRSGISIKKLYPITFNYFPFNGRKKLEGKKNNVVIFFGRLNFRKGIDKIPEILDFLSTFTDLDTVTIIGKSENIGMYEYISENLPKTMLKVVFIQHLDFTSEQFKDLKSRSKFAIFPSREEGLAATVLDLISHGIPVIHSELSGIEITNILCDSLDFESSNWRSELRNKINDIDIQLQEIAKSQEFLYKEFHQNNFQIDRVLGRIKKDYLWPTIMPQSQDYDYVNYHKNIFDKQHEFETSFDTNQLSNNKNCELIVRSGEKYLVEKSVSLLDRLENYNRIFVKSEINLQNIFTISKVLANRINQGDGQTFRVYSSSLLEKRQAPIKYIRIYFFQQLIKDFIDIFKIVYTSRIKRSPFK